MTFITFLCVQMEINICLESLKGIYVYALEYIYVLKMGKPTLDTSYSDNACLTI